MTIVQPFTPERIYIHRPAFGHPLTRRIQERFSGVPMETVWDYREIRVEGETPDESVRRGKRRLVVAHKKGDFVKEFKQGCASCAEFFLAHGNGCPCDCEYCFLQSYFPHSVPTVFVNQDEMLDAIRAHIHRHRGREIVFHAGELCDSLVLDGITGLGSRWLQIAAEFPQARFELRTKSDCVDALLEAGGVANVVPSWTFSPGGVVDQYERGAASLPERIAAARRCQEAGYCVGLRLDPIFRVPDWEAAYCGMLDHLLTTLDTTRIESLVLGCFRFIPALAEVIRRRKPGSQILLDEFVPCGDGKYRYFRPLRTEVYRTLVRHVRSVAPEVPIFLCMETDAVRKEVFS